VRVLLHSIYYPPEVGGVESHVRSLAEGLVAAGDEVRVITSRSMPGLPREETVRGVRILRGWFPSRTPLGWSLFSMASLPDALRWGAWAELLHAQTFASVLPLGIAASLLRRPFVGTFHTSHFLLRAQDPRWRGLLGELVRWPDHTFAASGEIASVAEGLAPGVRVEVLVNGVDVTVFRPIPPSIPNPEGMRRILVPRRLHRKNGVDLLLRAMAEPLLRETEGRIEALLIGDGPERGALEELTQRLGLSPSVRFLGARPHHELPGLLASGEVVVIPSRMEATSIAALEAMACERPVVATAVGGLPELIDASVGRLVPPEDPLALAQAIRELLDAPDQAATLGRAGRERVVARWGMDRLVERHREVYGAVVRTGRRS